MGGRSWPLGLSCYYYVFNTILTSIITTMSPLSAFVIIISFLFASSSLFFVPLWIGFWIFHFFIFSLFRSFCTKSVNVLTLWWVSLGVLFCLFLIWKGRFYWSVLDFGLISLTLARSLIRQKTFSASLSNCLYFFGVGMKLRFLFKSLKVSKENECFDKFVTSPDIHIHIHIHM